MIRGAFHRLFFAAFTLIELLVVIAVVTLLLSISTPALLRARQQGRSIVCLSNLRQMGIAANAYTDDNSGFFPLSFFFDCVDFSCPPKNWDFFRTYENGQVKECTPGFLWQGQGILRIQQCPSFKGNSNSVGDPFTGYNYNTSYIGGSFSIGNNGMLVGCNSSKIEEVKRPQDCAVFGDGQLDSAANKYMRSPQAGKLDKGFGGSNRYAGAQGYRHLGRTNVGYCDGSAASVSEVFTNTKSRAKLEEYNKKNKIKIGFLSSDNSAYDLQ